MFKKFEELIEALRKNDWAKVIPDQDEFWSQLVKYIEEHIFPEFLVQITDQVDEITEISPDLSEPEILERVTRYMVEFLGARSASVRIYDPDTEQMLSYGSYPSEEKSRETYIPLEGSVAGEVVRTHQTYLVSDILQEKLYQDKEVIEQKQTYSMMAVPLAITRFSPRERDTVGVIQIYYPERDRTFSPLEIQMAELMSRRLSFVIARKKILSMYMVNEKKEAIVSKIFLKLGSREGIKMREVFNRVIPELVDIINLQSCALFSVADDLKHVVLEAGYPDSVQYHGIGKRFPINSEPAFELVLKMRDYIADSPYEMVTNSYVLVMDPEKSNIVSNNLKQFALNQNINSILYVPLTVGEEITHFMTFDALDYRKRYTQEEIDIFLFLGRELMKAQRMEHLDDILHDFKNPAIATAGFARRLKRLIEEGSPSEEQTRIKKYLDILLEETSRLQEMAMSLSHVGKEQIVNLTDVLKSRFEINKEAIKEQLKQNVVLQEGPFHTPLYVQCYPVFLERLFDNLLNNATNAIPLQGGILSIRTFKEGDQAFAEITNTGVISDEERIRLMEGKGSGRGLYISHRIMSLLKGKIDIHVGRETTTLSVQLPLHPNS